MIILILILLPVLIGYWWGATRYFRDKAEIGFWKIERFFKSIPSRFKKLTTLIDQTYYNYFILPTLKDKTRKGDVEALAQRLTRAKLNKRQR